MDLEETITIKKSEYDSLVQDAAILQALYDAGVDNWQGYSIAMEEFK